MATKRTKILIGTCALGAVLLILGLVLGYAVFPNEIPKKIAEAVRLEEGSEQWDRFEKLPIPLLFKVYLFEVSNINEVILGAKPAVVERGPYVYREGREKNSLQLSDNDEFVSYKEVQTYEFDEEASKTLKETDEITVLNIPLIATIQISEGLPAGLPFDFNDILKNMFTETTLFIKTSVKKLLFDGLRFCDPNNKHLGAKLYCMIVTILDLQNVRTGEDGWKLLSFLDFKNNKDTGLFKINTGMTTVSKLGEISEWDNSTYSTYWKGEESTCNKVHGRDATIYPPSANKDDSFTIFSTDICRTVEMTYKSESEYKEIKALRFETGEDMLTDKNPEESCYCLKKTKNEIGSKSCFLDGFLDMQSCFGAPILASNPHFLFAADKYKDMVDGLDPKNDAHNSYCELEPNTGTPLKGAKRLQFNMVIRPITVDGALIAETQHLQGSMLPMLWVDEGVELTDEYIEKINSMYFDTLVILDAVQWSLVGVAVAIIVVSAIIFFVCKGRN